jgi:hypothetical protein
MRQGMKLESETAWGKSPVPFGFWCRPRKSVQQTERMAHPLMFM